MAPSNDSKRARADASPSHPAARSVLIPPCPRPRPLSLLPESRMTSWTIGTLESIDLAASLDQCHHQSPADDDSGYATSANEGKLHSGDELPISSQDLEVDDAHESKEPVSPYGCTTFCDEPEPLEGTVKVAPHRPRLRLEIPPSPMSDLGIKFLPNTAPQATPPCTLFELDTADNVSGPPTKDVGLGATKGSLADQSPPLMRVEQMLGVH